jgi:hypothetical protein
MRASDWRRLLGRRPCQRHIAAYVPAVPVSSSPKTKQASAFRQTLIAQLSRHDARTVGVR